MDEKKLIEIVSDHIQYMDIDFDTEDKVLVTFELYNGAVSFDGTATWHSVRSRCGVTTAKFNVDGEITLTNLRTEEQKVIPYNEKDFEDEWIYDEWKAYGVKQSDFL